MESARPITIRAAVEKDQDAIAALVHSEHLNPHDLDWRCFVVATDVYGIVGAAQMRRHADGSRELGSLVVRRNGRRRGIAGRLIDMLLATHAARAFMITGAAFAEHYSRWGFRRIDPADAPAVIRRNYFFGQLVGGALSLLKGRWPRRLAVLDRPPKVRRPQSLPTAIERDFDDELCRANLVYRVTPLAHEPASAPTG